MKGQLTKGADLDLGLAISGATLPPGCRRTNEEIAAYCGCSRQNISVIEHRALKKLRLALYRDKDLGKELKESLFKAIKPR